MFEIEELADKIIRGDGSIRDYIIITRKMSRVCRGYAAKYTIAYNKTPTPDILGIPTARFTCIMGILTAETTESLFADRADTPRHNHLTNLWYDGISMNCDSAPTMTVIRPGVKMYQWRMTAAEYILITRMFKMQDWTPFETVDNPATEVNIARISMKLLVNGEKIPYTVHTVYDENRPFLYVLPCEDIYSASRDIGSFKNFRRVRMVAFPTANNAEGR
jgi:hypothetical protein